MLSFFIENQLHFYICLLVYLLGISHSYKLDEKSSVSIHGNSDEIDVGGKHLYTNEKLNLLFKLAKVKVYQYFTTG